MWWKLPFGLQAAKRAGAIVICKKDDRLGYDQSGADYYIDRLAEIEEICFHKKINRFTFHRP